MTIQKVIGENGVLPQVCRGGLCPAAVVTAEGEIFVQGFQPAAAENAQLSAPNGEAFVKMSKTTFEAIARQVLAS